KYQRVCKSICIALPALRQSLQGGLYKIPYVVSYIADMVGVTLSVLGAKIKSRDVFRRKGLAAD
ncbi:MAG: hypothetical protein AAGD15_20875, partial [Agrobacterium cavarae]|uniref:hypothetical protein n=1 Tax=Agrobacterium cavarae TaxID=2528239 RepID=UPI0031A7D7FE